MKIEVKDYQPEWEEKFNIEAQKLKAIFNEEVIHIHHIGSTSVKELKAKPIIDIMLVVKNIEKIDSFNKQMAHIDYESLGEYGIPGRRYFRKRKEERTHHVHIFDYKNRSDIERHLAFRDYLRAHKEVAKEYGKLKEKLAKKYPEDMNSYVDGKDKYVKEIQTKAINWYR